MPPEDLPVVPPPPLSDIGFAPSGDLRARIVTEMCHERFSDFAYGGVDFERSLHHFIGLAPSILVPGSFFEIPGPNEPRYNFHLHFVLE